MDVDIESKLDEDFLFYLGFTNSFSQKIKDPIEQALCQNWLQKMCGEPFVGIDAKRNRNVFLSNLILCMQETKLSEPFTINPDNVDIMDSKKWFATVQGEVTTPVWLNDVVEVDDESRREDGRTYVATRVMPGNRGAFAYVAINLEDDKWLGGGEGVFDMHMKRKYQEVCPPPNEMELILAKRRDPVERQRVLTFYDVMLQNIADEMDEKITAEENNAITVVLNQLVEDLKRKNRYEEYENMDEKQRREELLFALFDKTKARRDKVAKREEVLDDIEAEMRESFYDSTHYEDEDKYEMPAQMWEYIINRPPNKKNMIAMQQQYPGPVYKTFRRLVSDQKEEIAMRLQRRHCNIVTQMKKELRKEGEKMRSWVEDARVSCEQAVAVIKAVKEAYAKQEASCDKTKHRAKGGDTELTKLYNEMKATLFDTQLSVEDEAQRGRVLTEQINEMSAQSEAYKQVTKCTIIKSEEANMEIMKNIKRLQKACTQHENRLAQIQMMAESRAKNKSSKGGGAMLIL